MSNIKRISVLIVCVAAAISSATLVAQVDPNQPPNPMRSEPDSTAVPGVSH